MQDRAPIHFPIALTHEVAIGRQPTERELADLANSGFKSIINVRGAQELDQPISPVEEGRLVERAGMSYLHSPITVADLDDRVADHFLEILTAIDKPVLVHCENGLRAALLALMFVACDEKRGGDWVLERAQELGFEVRAPLLRTFARAYVDRNLRIHGFVRRSA
jgi:uncharacterized protein (TIGR01244 family)